MTEAGKKKPAGFSVGGLLTLGFAVSLGAERTHTTDPASSGRRNPLSGARRGFSVALEHVRKVYRPLAATVNRRTRPIDRARPEW
jgi:hypothetical protein